jgi:hypothetical protein
MIWLTHIAQRRVGGTLVSLEPTDAQREAIAVWAIDCAVKHIGYNYLDFVAIALAQQRLNTIVNYDNPPWWVKRLSNPRRLICSQLADYAWDKAGVHLFADKRPAGLVSPNDLFMLSDPAYAV